MLSMSPHLSENKELAKKEIIDFLKHRHIVSQKLLEGFLGRCSEYANKVGCSRILKELENDKLIIRWRNPNFQKEKIVVWLEK